MDCVAKLKILLLGESGVGKSSIILAFTKGDYQASFPATIGVDYNFKVVDVNGVKVKLGIWDTAGQERYRTLTSSFYRDAHGAILVYDVSEPKTLAKLNEWVEELQVYTTNRNIVCLVVGNKIDKPRMVAREQGQAFAQKHRMLFIESSAKTQEGINLAFEELAQKPRMVAREQGQAFAQKHRMLFIESSAKTQEGINLAFEELAQKIIETPGLWEKDTTSSNIRITDEERREQGGSCYDMTCMI